MTNGGDNQTPYLHLNLGTDAVKNRNWAILDRRLYDLARGLISNIPAGGDLTGFYPDPTIKDGAMTPAKIAPGGDPGETLTIDAGGHLVWINSTAATTISPTPPTNPLPGQLWWRDDPDGTLFVYYQDVDSAQWVPATPSGGGGAASLWARDVWGGIPVLFPATGGDSIVLDRGIALYWGDTDAVASVPSIRSGGTGGKSLYLDTVVDGIIALGPDATQTLAIWKYGAQFQNGLQIGPNLFTPGTGTKPPGISTLNAGTLQWTGTNFQGYNGTAWVNLDVQGGSGGAPSGAAGGDLGGTYPNPTVVKASGAFAVSTNLSVTGITVVNTLSVASTATLNSTLSVTGTTTLGRDPASPLEAATKQYVDVRVAPLPAPGDIGKTVVVTDPALLATMPIVLRADTLALADGAAVATWTNSGSGGAAFDATGASTPTYVANVLNGKPVVRFGGGTQALTITSVPIASGKIAALAVCRATAAGNYPMVLAGTTNDKFELRGNGSTRTPEFDYNATIVTGTGGMVGALSGWHIFAGVYTSSTATGYLDGNVIGSGAISGLPLPTYTLTVGNRGTTFPFTGDIAEIIIIGNDLVTADRQTLEGYLAWKYGLQANLPAGHPYKSVGPPPVLAWQPPAWTIGASTLTPTAANMLVAVPGDATGAIVLLNTATAKGRVQSWNSGAAIGSMGIASNRNLFTNAQDDATKPSWGASLRLDADYFSIQRAPAGSTTQTSLLTLDATGKLTIGADPTGALDVATKQYVDAHVGGGGTAGGDLTGTYPNPTVWRAAAGFQVSTTFIVGGTTSLMSSLSVATTATISGQLLVPTAGTAFVTGPLTAKGRLQAHPTFNGMLDLSNNMATDSAGTRTQDIASLASWLMRLGAGGTGFEVYRSPAGSTSLTSLMSLDQTGNLIIAGANATKSAGTAWIAASDRRIKDAIEDYPTGLSAILQLQPRTFLYNGKGGSTAGMRGYGFVADEIAPVMPETIGVQARKLDPDDEADTDIQVLDQSNLILALVNATKELANRVAALETR